MQHYQYWSSPNPHLTDKVLLHPVKVGVWFVVSARMIVIPVFFNKTIVKDVYTAFSTPPVVCEL
jgi:hypothetical protein